MAILVLQHHAVEPPGRLGDILRDHGHRLRIVELFDGDPLPPDLDNVDGVVSLGGPANVGDDEPWMRGELDLLKAAHEAQLPMVGVCLGAQMIAEALGGEVGPMDGGPEAGLGPVQSAFPGTIDPMFGGIPWKRDEFHLHGQEVKDLPPGATPLAGSKACRTQAYKVGLRVYGFQYHFEWTRDRIGRVLDANREWLAGHRIKSDELKAGLDDGYAMHRHLGDRLCSNLTNLLFPIDKRIPDHGEVVANYHAHRS